MQELSFLFKGIDGIVNQVLFYVMSSLAGLLVGVSLFFRVKTTLKAATGKKNFFSTAGILCIRLSGLSILAAVVYLSVTEVRPLFWSLTAFFVSLFLTLTYFILARD